MNTAFLQTQLQLPYRRGTWQTLLPQLFPGLELFSQPVVRPLTTQSDRTIASGLCQIGRAILRDNQNAERVVAIFEVEVAPKVDLVRNRVALRQLVARCIDEVSAHAVLAFFVQSGVRAYRLTYAARESVLTSDLKVETRETATKRFTYVLGPGETRRTAAQRLAGLAQNREKIQWKDITDAFSVEKLNDEFFKTYKQHYQAFCHHLIESDAPASVFHLKLRTLKDKELDKALKPVRDFIKRLLGRLVFLHFLQKKGWMGYPANRTDWTSGDPEFIQTWFANRKSGGNFYRDFLVPLFYDALNNNDRTRSVFAPTGTRVPYLNGGLFERELVPQSGHKPLEVEKLDLPDSLFSDLLDFFGQYNFTIDENDPDDHEIGIDPEMLGHVFENLLEDNKDKGAYYTPKAIVQYMCQQSLIHYLHSHFPDDPAALAEIERLIRFKEPIDAKVGKNWLTLHAHRLEQLLDEVKICDPAIGSGAFPIGLLQEIYWTKLTLHPGMNRAKAKRDIIQKSIYGVDIDAGAVEIARLRCWLALIVEEDQPRPLPNLDFKIMQGDSLLESFEGIPLDQLMPSVRPLYEQTVQQKELDLGSVVREKLQLELTDEDRQRFAKLLGDYFPCEDPAEKSRLHAEIDGFVLKHLDFNVDQFLRREEAELAQIQSDIDEKRKKLRKYDPSAREQRRIKMLEVDIRAHRARKVKLHELADIPERPYFLWHLFFQDVFARGGFDIVIANPPYRGFHSTSAVEKTQLASRYRTARGKFDLYLPFIERALDLMRLNAVFCFICPTAFMKRDHAEDLRGMLVSDTTLLELVDFEHSQVFSEVTNYTGILLLRKGRQDAGVFRVRVGFSQKETLLQQDTLGRTPWIIMADDRKRIANLMQKHPLLGTIAHVSEGIVTGLNRLYLQTSDELRALNVESNLFVPCTRGREIGRFHISEPAERIFYPYRVDGGRTIAISEDAFMANSPRLYAYLNSKRDEIMARGYFRDSGKAWFEIWNQRRMTNFTVEKIVTPELSDRNRFAIADANVFYGDTVCGIAPNPGDVGFDAWSMVALLNSSLLEWWYKLTTVPKAGGFFIYKVMFLRQLPIASPTQQQRAALQRLAHAMTRKASQSRNQDHAEDMAELDEMVFTIYEIPASLRGIVMDDIRANVRTRR